MEKPAQPAEASPSGVQLAAATPVLAQSIPSAQTAAQDVAPAAAPTVAELAQLLQTMARDLASVEQGIVQLKATQEQAVRDNAKATEELKASQEQVTRLIAKLSEHNKGTEQAPRPRTTAFRAADRRAKTCAGASVAASQGGAAAGPDKLQPDDDQ